MKYEFKTQALLLYLELEDVFHLVETLADVNVSFVLHKLPILNLEDVQHVIYQE
jgi:hypothetical protein